MTARPIKLTEGRPCWRCGRPGLLTAHLPHGWHNNSGHLVEGTVPVVLCQHCDYDAPGAGPLIAFLSVHGPLTDADGAEVVSFARPWLAALPPPVPDLQILEQELEAWRRGELD